MKHEVEKQARFFNLGEQYFWLASQNELAERQLRPYLRRLARENGRQTLRILDLGCGPGNTLRRLAPAGRVYGFDYSLDALAFARSKGIQHVFSGELTALPVASGAFDCVIALDVLEHVEDDQAALREAARVLRPRGVFLFTVPAFMALWRYHDEAYGHFRRYGRADFRRRVLDAGLEVRVCRFFKRAFFLPLLIMAALERRGWLVRRDNFFTVPSWLNRLLAAQIVWEDRSRLGWILPFGVSLLCVGHRTTAGQESRR
jgi:SAM-dependent methyltransferase